ncbi:major histocompatibility complex class I-related gene protein-like [Epinephelus moara]|uniref:major histocompatibility complex class I-related gene protein-like n=1 Tax=Epinephelus moara TaxID=300413 RepID=UPI00214E84ED|nr:major histocompatibility complex class I-related gene protein-like [Epinephelus moara]
MQINWNLLTTCLLLSAVECGSHSLEFLSTGHVQPGSQPFFDQLTVFDRVPISYCDTLTKREQVKPILASTNFPKYCDDASYDILYLHNIPPFINSTAYVVQRRRGCIQSADGMVSGFEVWAVNGTDFISFDPGTKRWTSQSPSAITVQHQWNKKKHMNFGFSHFIKEECPEMIQTIQLRSIPQKTELRIFAKSIENKDEVLLRCHVTSTDRSLSSLHLIGNGASRASSITVTGPVPSGDGSVILRLTARISQSQNTNTYGCTIQTGGQKTTVFWDGSALDGRYLLHLSSAHWKILTVILGFFCTVSAITILSCATIFLLKCVKKKSSPPLQVDPQLMEQFSRMMESVASPDLQSVLISFTRVTERNREFQQQWEVSIRLRDQNDYDPEYFGHQVGAR